MIAALGADFVTRVRQTVGSMLPAGYQAEARYLVERIAAFDPSDMSGVIDRLRPGLFRGLYEYAFNPLQRHMSFIDSPIAPEPDEFIRIELLCRSAESAIYRGAPDQPPAKLPDGVVDGMIGIARDLARADGYQAAVNVGTLAHVLDVGRHGNPDEFLRQTFAWSAAKNLVQINPRSASRVADVAKDLYLHGRYAPLAAVVACTMRPAMDSHGSTRDDGSAFASVWSKMEGTMRTARSIQANDDYRGAPLATGATNEIRHVDETRHINAWIEDAEGSLKRGHSYKFWINIGELRARSRANARLADIDWGSKTELTILVVLSGPNFEISPDSREFTLPKTGNTEPVSFDITPLRSPLSTLQVRLLLARELTLLEAFEVPIEVVEAARAA